MTLFHPRRSLLAFVATALVAAAAATGVLAAGDLQMTRVHELRTNVSLTVDTSACRGFSPAGALQLRGRLLGQYDVWASSVGNEEKGWTDVKALVEVGGHVYRIRQRYLFEPRQYREYVDGWAATVVTRDDGASMLGASWLGLRGSSAGPVEGVWWQGTPACLAARQR